MTARRPQRNGNAPADALSDRLTVTKAADDTARDFGTYSALFDGQAIAPGQRLDVAPNIQLIRRC